jgi:selenide,water dikinase
MPKTSRKKRGGPARAAFDPARPGSNVRLTRDVVGGGCAAKLGPGELAGILAKLPAQRHRNLLVGSETSDDAGVYRVRPDLAVVNTVDFFPPLVDDPYEYGRIAAANALSDVYAMGGKPITALNVVLYSADTVSPDTLAAVLAGGAERAAAAGVVVVGGHTICDKELKYGMAVTGLVHPKRFVRNVGARKGDLLVLTKPLGTGILATGIKRAMVEDEEEHAAIASMVALNDVASSLLRDARARACTDVTGFGLAGHGAEMVRGSAGVRLEIDAGALPLLPGTARLAEAGCITGGSARNRAYLGKGLALGRNVEPAVAEAVVDPQTSGGLLVSLPAREAPGYVEALHARGLRPALIGRVASRPARSAVEIAVE